MPAASTLPQTVIGLDVETTSLDPSTGEIIEVSAIRYRIDPGSAGLGEERAELTLLTRPSEPLSDQITAITGITNNMLSDAPAFREIIPRLQQFIGSDPIFAHNAPFDISYLTHHGVAIHQPVWDTFTLAGVAWPTAPSYNLGMLADLLHITAGSSKKPIESRQHPREHRAGDDVRLTWQVLQRIYKRLLVPADLLAAISELLDAAKQSHYQPLFRELQDAPSGKPRRGARVAPQEPESFPTGLTATNEQVLGTGGLLELKVPGFRYRPQQLDIAKQVTQHIEERSVGFIEASTGTGKTYGYLVPLLQAVRDIRPVMVSTYTKSLQDQLIKQDLPRLLRTLKLDTRAAVLKGRRNYLCRGRLERALQTVRQPEDIWLLIKCLLWLAEGGSGDIEELNVSHHGSSLLRHLHADTISCRQTCPQRHPDCPYQQARRAARQADLVIVNHSLLIQLAEDEQVIPVRHVVIDEAHHLVSAARRATARDLSERRVGDLLAPLTQLSKLGPNTAHIRAEAEQLLTDYRQLLEHISHFMKSHAGGETLRLTKTVRRGATWQKIRHAAENWNSKLAFLSGLLGSTALSGTEHNLLREALEETELFRTYLSQFIEGVPDRIQWLQRRPGHTNNAPTSAVALHDVALSVTENLSRLYRHAWSITLTSATLTVSGDFSYIKRHSGAQDAQELRVGSPFNYRDNMLICIVEDSLGTADPGYDAFVAEILTQVCSVTHGRLLGLFTSHQAVRNAYYNTLKKLKKGTTRILAQRLTGGRHNIVSRFKQNPHTVLLGTYSFWEGIDVPGENLSVVLIPKLPFPPPNDPIIEAVAQAEHLSAFEHFSVPEMLLKLRQGIGRLIRTTDDRGAVIMLDPRFLSGSYSTAVFNSLPPATIRLCTRAELVPYLADWFGEQTLKSWSRTAYPTRQ